VNTNRWNINKYIKFINIDITFKKNSLVKRNYRILGQGEVGGRDKMKIKNKKSYIPYFSKFFS